MTLGLGFPGEPHPPPSTRLSQPTQRGNRGWTFETVPSLDPGKGHGICWGPRDPPKILRPFGLQEIGHPVGRATRHVFSATRPDFKIVSSRGVAANLRGIRVLILDFVL